ncbi:MAG TPA: protein translocase subunit SecF [Vicinamibacterales bacterium]
MALFQNANYNFIKWRWHALALSAVIIIAGLAYGFSRGVPLGIDFSGGTIMVVKFEQPVSDDQVRNAIASVTAENVIQTYGDPADNQKVIRIPQLIQEEGASLDQNARAVMDALTGANLGKIEVISQDLVGPVVGADLQRKGLMATLLSIIGITIYIGLRFQFAFAIGAIAATLHDILITLAFLFFFGYELSLNVVAALLTITGYSVNDTIVIFDRVRENRRTKRRENLEKVVNDSVNQTLSRTVITAGTTFLSVLALFLFGGEVLEGFAFTMLVGIISGTYSTIFIASSIAIILANRQGAGRVQGARKESAAVRSSVR